jgi:hypothetical protein
MMLPVKYNADNVREGKIASSSGVHYVEVTWSSDCSTRVGSPGPGQSRRVKGTDGKAVFESRRDLSR